jgi:hypothetical protein
MPPETTETSEKRHDDRYVAPPGAAPKGTSSSDDLPDVRPGFGGAKGLIHLAPDFDEPLPDFDDYA